MSEGPSYTVVFPPSTNNAPSRGVFTFSDFGDFNVRFPRMRTVLQSFIESDARTNQ